MVSARISLRVRYGETDKMGFVYYGNYPLYYESGRTELMRNLGLSYRKLEESGYMLPVIDMQIKYIKPAYYDDEIEIITSVKEMPTNRIVFHYEVFRNEELLNYGSTTLIFVHASTMKACKPPLFFLEKLRPYFFLI